MLGLFSSTERSPDAQVLFAAIHTIGRQLHLDRFPRDAFDYIVIDEFHYAAALTYLRLVDCMEPAFLLGLSATPERSDDVNLLGLCDQDLIYQCTVPRRIREELRCAISYFGIPDDVEYRNIFWRNVRFDREALTAAVATQARSRNNFEQWRKRAGKQTIGHCVSQRHADHMAGYLSERGVACAAVCAGASIDPRLPSRERLAAGALKVIFFTVDILNMGVDIQAIDAVTMRRPLEASSSG